MDEVTRKNCKKLRDMESAEAAEWIISNYPDSGAPYINSRIWKKDEQLKLANHFLANLPHASAICYRSLLKAMPAHRFVSVVRDHIPSSESDIELLRYYLYPVLKEFSIADKDKVAFDELRTFL